jgi:hypothetical protein
MDEATALQFSALLYQQELRVAWHKVVVLKERATPSLH